MGRRALHDMTMIVPGASKGPAFEKGQVIGVGDLCRLQQMGRQHLYVLEDNQVGPEWVHEDEAALAFARALAGEGVTFTEPPREGKVNLLAARDGLLVVDEPRLEMFNLVPGVMCACRQGFTLLTQGRVWELPGPYPCSCPGPTSIRPWPSSVRARCSACCPCASPGSASGNRHRGFHGPGGGQVFPIITTKVEKFGGEVLKSLIVPDDRRAIGEGVQELLNCGMDLLVTTAGLSVDPDDVTRQGLVDAGATDILYGAPILPGAMTLLAHIGPVQVMGCRPAPSTSRPPVSTSSCPASWRVWKSPGAIWPG